MEYNPLKLSESGLVQAIPSKIDEPGDAIDPPTIRPERIVSYQPILQRVRVPFDRGCFAVRGSVLGEDQDAVVGIDRGKLG